MRGWPLRVFRETTTGRGNEGSPGGEVVADCRHPSHGSLGPLGPEVLRTGDIVFRMGDARLAHGYFKISRFLAKCSNSEFSHTGIVSIRRDELVVYDTTRTGVARQPFCVWVLDNVGQIGVKRVKPEYKDAIPKVIAYLHKVTKNSSRSTTSST